MATQLDPGQVLKEAFDDASESLKILSVGGTLTPEEFDSYDVTYVAAGNGAGEVETVTYKLGGSTVATLTFTYNADNKITNVTKT